MSYMIKLKMADKFLIKSIHCNYRNTPRLIQSIKPFDASQAKVTGHEMSNISDDNKCDSFIGLGLELFF